MWYVGLMGCSLIQTLKDLPLLPWVVGKNALSKVKDTFDTIVTNTGKKIEGKA